MAKTVEELREELDNLTGRRKLVNQEPAKREPGKLTPEAQKQWDDFLVDYRPAGK